MNNSNKKNSCLVVFSPKIKELFNNRKRFFVTINTLDKYIGSHNAHIVRSKLTILQADKGTFKFRSVGKIEIYQK